MKKTPKVSLISPCYNGSSYIKWFLDSLVNQTYKNVEFIFINDGSTDNTEEIFMSYKSKLEKKGWQIIYIKQENKGLAATINTGLQVFTGNYVFFPDSDDILLPDHISEKVNFMEKNPEYAVAFCLIDAVNDRNLDKTLYTMDNSKCDQTSFSDNLINRKLSIWTGISSVFRSKCLLDVLPNRSIYPSRSGQNFQLLFPISLKYKIGYIHKILGKYVIRSSSMSRTIKSKPKHNAELFDIWVNTILSLDDTNANKAKYINKSYNHFVSSAASSPVGFCKKVLLFGCVPLVKIKKKNNKTKIYFLGIYLFTIKD